MTLRTARLAAGWTPQELARITGIHMSHIYRIEAGQHAPSARVRDLLVLALEPHLRAEDLPTRERGRVRTLRPSA